MDDEVIQVPAENVKWPSHVNGVPIDPDASTVANKWVPDFRAMLSSAPTVNEVLAHPDRYEAWLTKAQEALNA